jgi:Flp pilus assembly protein TadG
MRRRGEEGQTLLEFALLLPLLAALLVGIILGGVTFYDDVTLADAVRVGARTLAVNRSAGAGPPTACTLANTALTSAAVNLNQSLITIAPETFTGSGGSTCSNLVAGDTATVQATYPCNLTIPFVGINLCPVVTTKGSFISSQTTVRIE